MNLSEAGEKTSLRKPANTDIPLMIKWREDGGIMGPMGFPLGIKKDEKNIRETLESFSKEEAGFWVIQDEKENAIGEFSYEGKDGVFSFDIMIGEPEAHGKGYGKASLLLGLKKIFCCPNAEKIIIHVNPDNQIAMNLYLSVGFRQKDFIRNSWTDQLGTLRSEAVLEMKKTDWESFMQ